MNDAIWLADYASMLILLIAASIPIGAFYKKMGPVRFALFITAVFIVELPARAIQATVATVWQTPALQAVSQEQVGS